MTSSDFNLRLPYPPTVNHYWGEKGIRVKATGKLRAIKYLTKRAKDYRADIDHAIHEQIGFAPRLEGRLGVAVDLHYGPSELFGYAGVAPDIDAGIKPLLDALEDAKFFINDSQVDELLVLKRRRAAIGYVDVLIRTFGE